MKRDALVRKPSQWDEEGVPVHWILWLLTCGQAADKRVKEGFK